MSLHARYRSILTEVDKDGTGGVFVREGRDGPPRAARTQITPCYIIPCCVILNEHVDGCGLRAV